MGLPSGSRSVRAVAALAFALSLVVALTACRGSAADETPVPRPVIKTSGVVVAVETPPAPMGSVPDERLEDLLAKVFGRMYPQFSVEATTGDDAAVIAMGDKKAADVLIVRARGAAAGFIADGRGVDPRPVMHTEFVIVGPANDPARVKGSSSAADAFKKIANRKAKFFSPGAGSAVVYAREQSVWASGSVDPTGTVWYQQTGKSAYDTLKAATTGKGYALVERATWSSSERDVPGLVVLVGGVEDLLDRWVVVRVAGTKNAEGATAFSDWVTRADGGEVIRSWGEGLRGTWSVIPDASH